MVEPHAHDKNYTNLDTIAVHVGRPAPGPDVPMNPPIVASSTLHAGGPIGYHRDGNETLGYLETLIGTLEGGHATVFSSGMAAANAAFDLIPMGGVIVASQYSYTGVAVRLGELHNMGRLVLRLVDVTDANAVAAAIRGDGVPANWVWIESPTNPMMEICDIRSAATVAREVGAILAIDNTFMTPVRQRPLELGATVVMHSVTKGLAGHSDLLMGALVTNDAHLHEEIIERRVLLGAVPSAFDGFLAVRGIRTLSIRVERAEQNAQALAERLLDHPAIKTVLYPGLPSHPNADIAKEQTDGPGTVLSFDVKGTAADADKVCKAVQLISYATSLGGVETLMERRRRWEKENVEVPETLIRMAVGIENVEDLWRDLKAALDTIV